jgi:hypothetical protein
MTTRTEAAIKAYYEALDTIVGPEGYPRVTRNETLNSILENIGDGDGARINVLDGVGEIDEIMASADSDASIMGYELIQHPEIEIISLATDAAKRDAVFDQMLEYVAQSVEADRTLGGVVDYAEIERIEREHVRIEGLPYIKGGIITLVLSFTSSRPF